MGMFDYVECEYPFPGNVPDWVTHKSEFQTKDLKCLMDRYILSADGKLYILETEWEENPDYDEDLFHKVFGPEKVRLDKKDYRKMSPGSLKLTGNRIEYKDRFQKLYHGRLLFYVYRDSDFVDLLATFNEGTLTTLERVKNRFKI